MVRSRIASLTQIRGLAIIFIICYHFILELSRFSIRPKVGSIDENIKALFLFPGKNLPEMLANVFSAIFSIGWEYVGVFLFLSGFGLTYSRLIKNNQENFFSKRIRKLIPGWHLAIIFAFFINLLSLAFFKPLLISTPTLNPLNYFYLLLFPMVVDFNFNFIFSVNPSLWFIFLIFQFYVIFDLLYAALIKMGVKKFLLLSILVTLTYRFIIIYFFHQMPGTIQSLAGTSANLFNIILARLAEVALGMVTAYLVVGKEEIFHKISYRYYLLAAGLFIIGNLLNWNRFGWIFSDIVLTPSLTLLSLGLVNHLHFNFLKQKLTVLGDNSYAIYLFHNQPITQLLVPLYLIAGLTIGNPAALLVGSGLLILLAYGLPVCIRACLTMLQSFMYNK